jgi:peptidoglycan/xylan/chitin deacetylase (PgdA/CDA1 family)
MKRLWLSVALVHAGVPRAMLQWRRWTGAPWLLALTYHRVLPSIVEAIDREVAIDVATFERQLAFLHEHFDFIGMDDVLAAIGGAKLPPAPVLITFDDGYRDNHDVVLPILRNHGARAVFFVATDYIERRKLFWWDHILWTVNASTHKLLELTYPSPQALPLGPGPRERAKTIQVLLHVIKTHFGLDVPRFLDHLDEMAGTLLSSALERDLAETHVMNWDHVRALQRAGMDVQSHTHTHRILDTLAPKDIAWELRESRERLRDQLGVAPVAVSYPVGRATAYTDAIRAAVRDAGYRAAFSNRAGVNVRTSIDPLDLRRISPEGATDQRLFETVMAIPALAY